MKSIRYRVGTRKWKRSKHKDVKFMVLAYGHRGLVMYEKKRRVRF